MIRKCNSVAPTPWLSGWSWDCFFLSLFHYYTAGFGVLTHHWHVGFHLAFVLGLIYLVYTPHRNIDATVIPGHTSLLMIRWPDFIKIGVPSLFIYGMMGFLPALLLFSYFAIVVHFSRHIRRHVTCPAG